MPQDYYFISDLHIGGDGLLDVCDFEAELMGFLRELEAKGGDAELIIIGDVFGLWEKTGAVGGGKLEAVIASHRELFEQFRRTGEKVRVTVIPGNHDYELACCPECVELLAGYNISLEPREHITRTVAGGKIWIEHGSQHDSYNAVSDFGNPHATPFGYYVTRKIVGNAGKYSVFGRQKWLQDLESVYPNEHVPDWIISNYFYREMSPLLRWVLLPFLMLFGVSAVAYAGMLLEKAGILRTAVFSRSFIESFGIFGKLFGLVLMVNSLIITFLLIMAVPLWFIYRDVMKTLNRYGLRASEGLAIQKDHEYREAARRVFRDDPGVAVFIFGHTHQAFLAREGGRAVINTGTWLKKLTKTPSRFRLLPDVYYPSFMLNYFRIGEEDGRIAIEYVRVPKETESGLTLLQRFVTLGRRPEEGVAVPKKTIVDAS